MVNKDDYRAMMEKAIAELTELVARQETLDTEREQLDTRIAELKQGIMALGPLCGMQPQFKYADLLPEFNLVPVGLKDGVLAVLAMVKNDAYITPVAIRDNLASTGYELKSKNILPSIHNVLKRLESTDVESGDVNGKTGYRLIKKAESAPLLRRRVGFDELAGMVAAEVVKNSGAVPKLSPPITVPKPPKKEEALGPRLPVFNPPKKKE
jgi:hypothetical protein